MIEDEVSRNRSGGPGSAPDDNVGYEGSKIQNVAVYCLGPFALEVNGEPVDGWRNGKASVLFQYLVNNRNRSATRQGLICALWPDPDALAASSSLKVAIHALRQQLLRSPQLGSAVSVLAQNAGYQIHAPGLWLDVDEFERAYTLARRLDVAGRAAEAIPAYTFAARLYRGDFLEDSDEDWALLRRESLKDQYLLVLGRLAADAFARGDNHACIEWSQRILQYDSCREDAYRSLMVCHARLGQRARVQSWFDLCVRTLQAQLGVEPEDETEQTYHQALGGGTPFGQRARAPVLAGV